MSKTNEKNTNVTKGVKLPAERRYNEEKIGQKINEENDMKNLRYNLLLIRETYRILHKDQQSMKQFYEHIDVDADSYSLFLNSNYISKVNYDNLVRALTDCGIPKKYFSKTRAPKILASSTIEGYFEEYINPNLEKASKDECLDDIRTELLYDLYRHDKRSVLLIMSVYGLSTKIEGHTETDLHLASETLNKLIQHEFTDKVLSSNTFAGFITSLAKTVASIEELFPEFYAVAQQMKEDKSTQSVMNEIYNNLNFLNNMEITASDASSDSCRNMLLKISETMIKIAESIS